MLLHLHLNIVKTNAKQVIQIIFASSDWQINKEGWIGSDRQIRGESQGFKNNVGSKMLPIYKSKLIATIDKSILTGIKGIKVFTYMFGECM